MEKEGPFSGKKPRIFEKVVTPVCKRILPTASILIQKQLTVGRSVYCGMSQQEQGTTEKTRRLVAKKGINKMHDALMCNAVCKFESRNREH